MRTTLTIDPEIAERLEQEVALGKRSFKAIVNRRPAQRFGSAGAETRQALPREAGILPSSSGH